MENTVYPDGAVFVFLIENYMMPNLETKEPGLNDIILLFRRLIWPDLQISAFIVNLGH